MKKLINNSQMESTHMNEYENVFTDQVIKREDIMVVRLDGRCFSSFTRSLKKKYHPFHKGFTESMRQLCKYLVIIYNPVIAFTQSDEISLIFINKPRTEHLFAGKIFKIVSLLAADASLYYNQLLEKLIPEKKGSNAMFDCRVFIVPSQREAYNYLCWRRNVGYDDAVSSVAREYFPDNFLLLKNTDARKDLLETKDICFDERYEEKYKYGTAYIRERVISKLTQEELVELPENHKAKMNPELEIERYCADIISFADITKLLL